MVVDPSARLFDSRLRVEATVFDEPGMDREMAAASIPEQDLDRYYTEFFRALQNGLFGRGRRVRVLLASPDFGAWRLTPKRATLRQGQWLGRICSAMRRARMD